MPQYNEFIIIAMIACVLCIVIFEHCYKWNLVTMCTVVLGLFIVLTANIPLPAILLYLVIGIFWSIYRWNVFCNKQVNLANNSTIYDEIWLKEVLDITNNINKIVAWMINWPLSVILYLLKFIVITKWIKAIYNKISSNAINRYNKK